MGKPPCVSSAYCFHNTMRKESFKNLIMIIGSWDMDER